MLREAFVVWFLFGLTGQANAAVSSVAEPGIVALVATGALVLVMLRRRRR